MGKRKSSGDSTQPQLAPKQARTRVSFRVARLATHFTSVSSSSHDNGSTGSRVTKIRQSVNGRLGQCKLKTRAQTLTEDEPMQETNDDLNTTADSACDVAPDCTTDIPNVQPTPKPKRKNKIQLLWVFNSALLIRWLVDRHIGKTETVVTLSRWIPRWTPSSWWSRRFSRFHYLRIMRRSRWYSEMQGLFHWVPLAMPCLCSEVSSTPSLTSHWSQWHFLWVCIQILTKHSPGMAYFSTRQPCKNWVFGSSSVMAGCPVHLLKPDHRNSSLLIRLVYTASASTFATVVLMVSSINGHKYYELVGFLQRSTARTPPSHLTCSTCFMNSLFRGKQPCTTFIIPSSVKPTMPN